MRFVRNLYVYHQYAFRTEGLLCFHCSIDEPAASAECRTFGRGRIIHAVDHQHIAAKFCCFIGILLALVFFTNPFFFGKVDVQRPKGQLLILQETRSSYIPQVAAERDEALFAAIVEDFDRIPFLVVIVCAGVFLPADGYSAVQADDSSAAQQRTAGVQVLSITLQKTEKQVDTQISRFADQLAEKIILYRQRNGAVFFVFP